MKKSYKTQLWLIAIGVLVIAVIGIAGYLEGAGIISLSPIRPTSTGTVSSTETADSSNSDLPQFASMTRCLLSCSNLVSGCYSTALTARTKCRDTAEANYQLCRQENTYDICVRIEWEDKVECNAEFSADTTICTVYGGSCQGCCFSSNGDTPCWPSPTPTQVPDGGKPIVGYVNNNYQPVDHGNLPTGN
jgi:hypothetical protein